MRRSAISVPANIVEGCARRTSREFLQFLSNAFGSLRELGYFIDLAARLGLLDSAAANTLQKTHIDASCRLRNLIKSIPDN
jgi:four helix bundle protein